MSENGYSVHAPRAGDAVGSALRGIYDEELALPDDMTALLRKISARPATTRDII